VTTVSGLPTFKRYGEGGWRRESFLCDEAADTSRGRLDADTYRGSLRGGGCGVQLRLGDDWHGVHGGSVQRDRVRLATESSQVRQAERRRGRLTTERLRLLFAPLLGRRHLRAHLLQLILKRRKNPLRTLWIK